MAHRLTHKRGDTFELACAYTEDGVAVDLSAITVESQIRQRDGTLLTTLVVTLSDQGTNPGEFRVRAETAATQLWPVEALLMDIQYTDAGTVTSTETIHVQCVADQTL